MATKTPSPGEREAAAREDLIARYSAICPGIIGNPYVPHWPTPPQQLFLGLHQRTKHQGVFEALFGGAAGGGKSDCLLMALAQYVQVPGYAGLGVRKTFQDLALPGAIMARSHEWWRKTDAHWNGERKTWTFPGGSTVTFGYLLHAHDHLQYQGSEFDLFVADELTQLRMSQYEYIALSRVRSRVRVPVPPRALSASNPGGPSHAQVRQRFIGDPEAGVPPLLPNRFIPSRIRDNPHIDQDAYMAGLQHLHPTTLAQLRDGDWRARDPGDYFRSEWFGLPLNPETDRWPARDCIRIRWWDLAASEKQDAAYTAGVLMARHSRGVRAVEHVKRFQATPGKRDDLIVQTALADGLAVVQGIEIEGGSGGPAQFEALSKRLRKHGIRCVGARPRVAGPDLTDHERAYMTRNASQLGGKAGRADPVASCLERGYQRRGECADTGAKWWGIDQGKPVSEQADGIRIFAGPWMRDYLDELEGFPPERDGPPVDQVDATSGAWAWLEAHPLGLQRPVTLADQIRRPVTAWEDDDRADRKTPPRRRWSSRDS